MKTIIAGSRSIVDMDVVVNAIQESKFEITRLLCGMAQGVDLLGLAWAMQNYIPWDEYPAIWRPDGIYDPEAGFKRNQEMADKADALIAVWDGESGGTEDMIDRAKKAKLRKFIWNIKKPPMTFRFS